MRHKKKGRKLSRDRDHRGALLSNLVKDLIFYEEITTTHPKAKELVRLAEKTISLAREDSVHHRRLALKVIKDKKVLKKLFEVIGPRYRERKGGYVSLVKVGYRRGDGALLSRVKLV